MPGAITNNVLTAYSTGLALQAVGIPWKRAVTVIFDAVVAISITCYALFISDFLSTLNNILELTVAFLGPALAIYGIDILSAATATTGPNFTTRPRTAASGTGTASTRPGRRP